MDLNFLKHRATPVKLQHEQITALVVISANETDIPHGALCAILKILKPMKSLLKLLTKSCHPSRPKIPPTTQPALTWLEESL